MSQYSQRVQERRTRGQQTADMVSGSELVIDDDTERRYLVHSFNAVNRTRQLSCRSANKDDLVVEAGDRAGVASTAIAPN